MSGVGAPARHELGTRRPTGTSTGTSTGTLTGTWLAARLALRTSRIFWLTWLVTLAALLPATVSAYGELMPDTPAGRVSLVALAANPTMRAMLGPPYDLLVPGGFAMWRVGTFVAAAAAMMAALGVIRATREPEEDGRVELLRSGALGRHAPLAGALVVALGACAVLGAVVAASLAAMAPPATGALAAGLGIALVGATWAGVGGLAAQLMSTARGARFLAVGSLGAAYLLRAVADGSPRDSVIADLGWLSPVQWAALTRPYAGERWWVPGLSLLATALLVALAFVAQSRRDLGSGLRAARPGPADAAAGLRGPHSLVWRLERGAIVGWTLGMSLFALAIGSLAGTVGTMLDDNPRLAEMFRRLGGDDRVLRDSFYTTMLGIVVAVIALYAAGLLLRLRAEEESGRTELLAATGVRRRSLLLAHVLPALLAPSGLLVLTGALIAVPEAVATGEAGLVATITGAALTLAPGLWLVVALGAALLGMAPRLVPLLWVVLGWSMLATWVGALLGLPQWTLDLTPFAALPALPVESFAWAPVLVTTASAAALLGAALWGWGRRDLG